VNAIDFAVRAGRSYIHWTQPIAYLARRHVKECANLSGNGFVGGRCLDIGAGVAPYRAHIERHFGIDHYIELDFARSDKTNLIADASHLPLRTETIDLVVSFDVLQHIPDYRATLDEVVRVLRPGGALVFTVPFVYGEVGTHDYHRWTLEGIESELRARGLNVLISLSRGGSMFALTCFGVWAAQHLVPWQRRYWRSDRNALSILRGVVTMILTLPMLLLAWLGLGIDSVLPKSGLYMGVSVFARKSSS
jgi:SAM-dependent methyltransferase